MAKIKKIGVNLMEFNAQRVDDANVVISATMANETIAKNLDKVAKEASKNLDIQGFRKGKVPVAVVKQRYGAKLQEDAEGETLRAILADGLKELNVDNADIIGEPGVSKYEKKEDGSIEIEIKVATRPE